MSAMFKSISRYLDSEAGAGYAGPRGPAETAGSKADRGILLRTPDRALKKQQWGEAGLKRTYAAHIDKNGNIQTIKGHSVGTSRKAEDFSIEETKGICKSTGLLHDVGKYQLSFDMRIQGANVQTEHSICGAKEAVEIYGGKTMEGMITALCIAGHHTGIPDIGNRFDAPTEPTLTGRLRRNTEDYSIYKKDLEIPKVKTGVIQSILNNVCTTKEEETEAFAFFVRYCFSCLVDADTLDTMEANGEILPTPLSADFQSCLALVNGKLRSFRHVTELQRARSRIQDQAFKNISADSDIYLMEMPTGSGKTLASMKCALELAIRKKKKRIIYVIPYNSIIDQTVSEFENLFGDRAQILRHQSSFSYENEDVSEDFKKSAAYGCENWDAQIIITTAVQFFESIYSAKCGKTRKIHNMAESVLIFDEAHLMPVEFLEPCLRAVAFSAKLLHSSVLFLTATMPDYRTLIHEHGLSTVSVTDLVPDHSDFRYFSNKTYRYIGRTDADGLSQMASGFSSSLIVVNTRKKAREVFKKCAGKKFHLSKYMTGNDIGSTIFKIKNELQNMREKYTDLRDVPPEERIVVVSTSLIQAGVDLDFSAVFRELSGLDDILQAGGRSDREGLLGGGQVFIFEMDGIGAENYPASITRGVIREFDDISSEEAVSAYYDRFFKFNADKIVRNSMSRKCRRWDRVNIRSYSIQLIKDTDVSVIAVTDDKIRKLVEEGKHTGYINERTAQGYSFSVKPSELEGLIRQNVIDTVGNTYVLNDAGYYSGETGVQLTGHDAIIQ